MPVTCLAIAADEAGLKRPEIQVALPPTKTLAMAWSRYDIASISTHGSRRQTSRAVRARHRMPLLVRPSHPHTVVLARDYSLFAWLMPLLPAAFIFLGGGG